MSNFNDIDPSAPDRKRDHIEMALKSQVMASLIDNRFYYEPMLAGHPTASPTSLFRLGSKEIKSPIWVSSMTGGTAYAAAINRNLAEACSEFDMGMGLGSCRSLLMSDEYLPDFSVRKYIGDQPLYANLGIAQIEKLFDENRQGLIGQLLSKIESDGLIVHVNPLQEWLQPEGDRYHTPPIDLIKKLLDFGVKNIIVKEVGHGIGPTSLKALMQLPLAAIEFAANGGTNFSLIELERADQKQKETFGDLSYLGHSATEMVTFVNDILWSEGDNIQCKNFIISGGVKTFLDGYYLTQLCQSPSIYGQASSMLQHARSDYESLQKYITSQLEGFRLCHSLLKVKPLG